MVEIEKSGIRPGRAVPRGVKYGALTLLVSLLMGGVFGAFNAAPLQPAMAFASIVGVMVVLNALLSLVLFLGWATASIFKRQSPVLARYFLVSLGFSLIFLGFFLLQRLTGWYAY